MAQSQNTIREILIGNAVATETTLPTFLASASAGELAAIAADGGAAASGKDFYLVLKTGIAETPIIKSDIIKPSQLPKVKVRQKNNVAEVLRQVSVNSITVPAVAGEKAEYIVDIRLYNHGSLSVENFKIFHGHHILTQTAGPLTAEDVVDALILNLNKNFSREGNATATTNPLFTFAKSGAGAAAILTITAKAQTLDLGKDEGRPLQFDVMVKVNKADGVVGAASTAVVVAGNPGTGTGRQVAIMEYSYRGERGDSLRKLAFPYNWSLSTKSLADATGRYNLIELFHVVNGDGLNALIMPKEVTVAISEASGNVVADALKADIDAFL